MWSAMGCCTRKNYPTHFRLRQQQFDPRIRWRLLSESFGTDKHLRRRRLDGQAPGDVHPLPIRFALTVVFKTFGDKVSWALYREYRKPAPIFGHAEVLLRPVQGNRTALTG